MTQVERNNAASTIREYAFGQMNMLRMLGDDEAANNLQEAINMAIAALRGPQPDPSTGLVPCGCGFYPELRVDDRGWCQVYCTGCDMHGGNSQTLDNVIEEWNTAMGWKGGAE